MNKKYPALFNLLAGSFYQCWYEYDHRSSDEILYDSISQSTDEEIFLALKEVEKIISSAGSDADFGKILGRDIGCNYNPSDDGLSNLDWLLKVKRVLEERRKENGQVHK
ncbi:MULTISPECIES: contact-dependent growth inhibition system immunity protein [unclassified Microbulbifer]|uniref:contact-dependent growth inhibition system immunity protein n=1 Tax=unclassified Microbulbifer TaxID=2619833 RepID=UPI0027E4FC2F|nr:MULTISPECIES: contact-dependent growth inhibition system immunity protein [unclassified Microbulbifer]